MVKTEVKSAGKNEHVVHVQIAQQAYDKTYAEQLDKLAGQVKLPGFRAGKTPNQMLKQRFAGKLHEDTVSELIQEHYLEALESCGLHPAVQPELDIPTVQPKDGFEFTMKVVTWPDVKLANLGKLKFSETVVNAGDTDVQGVIDRLMEKEVNYKDSKGKAENGDELHIDFVGFVGDEPFEGGKGEDVALKLGEGRFIPGFEDQLLGKKAGEEVTVEVTFPGEYQARHLAGKAARFETIVKRVGKPEKLADDAALAKHLGFESADALREDVRKRLEREAEMASYETTRSAAFDALLAANKVALPEALIEQDVRSQIQRVADSLKQQGMPADSEMLREEAFRNEVRSRSERNLSLSVLLQAVKDQGGVDVSDAEIDAEIETLSNQYPAEQHDQFVAWVRSQKEQMEQMHERLLERKCVAYIVEQAKAKKEEKALSVWQAEQDSAEK